MTDFIEVYENALSDFDCQAVVGEFEYLSEMGFSVNRQQDEGAVKSKKDDLALNYSDLLVSQMATAGRTMVKVIHEKVHDYIEKYKVGMFANSDLKNPPYPICSESVKVQKTSPSQGYHVWHSEANCPQFSDRLIAWTLYLNNVEEGGETEFIYQSKRVKPEEGKLVIWPAGFTHTHRGNPPLSGEKYIATGWFRYVGI